MNVDAGLLEKVDYFERWVGDLYLDGGKLRYRIWNDEFPRVRELLEDLKARRDQIVELMRYRTESQPEADPLGKPGPPECPKLPLGVRLVRYQPKKPPVGIEICSVVTDVEKFLLTKLGELEARLHDPVQIRAGDSVFEILAKLEQVGLQVAIDGPRL